MQTSICMPRVSFSISFPRQIHLFHISERRCQATSSHNALFGSPYEQVSRQVSLLEQVGELEGALEQERKERCRLEGELVRHRAAGSSVSHQLLALYGQARDAGLALRRKLDQFERFQLQIALALEDGASSCGLPVASLTPDESRALIESGGEWNGRLDAPVDGDDDCFLRKNDFLREQCDQ